MEEELASLKEHAVLVSVAALEHVGSAGLSWGRLTAEWAAKIVAAGKETSE